MGKTTGIGWTTSTINFWSGCTRVSEECDRCYAETFCESKPWAGGWGPGAERKQTSSSTKRQLLKWNREAEEKGITDWRVFVNSLADIMDGEVPSSWREEVWEYIDQCPNLTFQLLTKRTENYRRWLPKSFKHNNVWIGTTAGTQKNYNMRWPAMMKLRERYPDAPLWISAEPLLTPLTIKGFQDRPDWLIVGGESGEGFRSMELSWAADLKEECAELGVPLFFKQMSGRTSPQAQRLVPVEMLSKQYPAATPVV